MSSPQVAVRMCPPEVDDSTFNDLMLTRDTSVPVSNSKPRCIEPEGEPDSEVVWANKPSWGQSVMHVPMKRPAFLGAANVPNLIRKIGMCMMMLSAVALNLTVIGALVKSQQTPAVVTTPSTKPKSVVARPALPNLPAANATSKAKVETMPKTAAPQEPEKQHEEHEEKVMSDSAAHFIIPVPMPPKVPLPPTVQEPVPDPDAAPLPPQENIGSVLSTKQEHHAVSDNEGGISVKMLLPGTEEMHTRDEQKPETKEEKEERERKRLRALLVEAEEDLGHEGKDASQRNKIEKKESNKKQGTGSGRLHTQDPNVMAHGSGGGMMAKWGSDVREKLALFGSEEAARKGPAKFMRMESTNTAALHSYTRQIKEAKAKRDEEEEKEKEEDDSLLEEVKRAMPSTVFGFR